MGVHSGGRAPISDDVKAEIYALHKDGVSNKSIASRLQISPSSVSKWLEHAGFDPLRNDHAANQSRDSLVAANRVRRDKSIAKRSKLSDELLLTAETMLRQVGKPISYAQPLNAGGGQVIRWRQNRPTPHDQGEYVRAAGIALNAHKTLTAMDDTG